MDTVLKKQTTSIFRVPPEDAKSIFFWNTASQTTCYPNLHHIMIIHQCEKLKQKIYWMVHAGKTKLQVHIMFWTNTAWHNVAALCTTSELRFVLPCQMKNKIEGYNITKAARHSNMQKVTSSTDRDGFTVNTNTQGTCNSQNKMKQIWQPQFVFHSRHDFQEFNGAQTVFWILQSTKIILH